MKNGKVPGAITIYVSPDGRDSWTGSRPNPSRDGMDGPFATVERAMREIRNLESREGVTAPVTVFLREGEYFLKRTLSFSRSTSGRAAEMKANLVTRPEMPIKFVAYGNEQPVISGGKVISGFKETTVHGRRAWIASVPEVRTGSWYFTQLFVNGERRYRPRLPRTGRYPIVSLEKVSAKDAWNEGQSSFYFQGSDVKEWKNLSDVLFVPFFNWVDDHIPIRSVDVKKRRCVLSRKSCYRLGEVDKDRFYNYCVENVFEALDQPGEWYLDRPTGTLYYLPRKGETLESARVIAARLERIVDIAGTSPEEPAEALHFDGITFAHNEWVLPENLDGVERGQGMPEAPAAVMLSSTNYSSFKNCKFVNTANYGLMLRDGCHDLEISGCSFSHMGAGGIKMWHTCHRNTIADNEIGYLGEMFPAGIGILVGMCDANKIIHNHVHHVYYSAISVGWDWGYIDRKRACGNVIEWNHLHDIGRHVLADMGAIYLLGIATGTRVRYNRIYGVDSSGYGGWGIYPDEGSTDLLIENNLVCDTSSSPFNQTFGKNNYIHNNIFAFGKGCQIMQTRGEDHLTVIFDRNIFLFEEGDVLGGHEGSFMAGNCTPATAHFEKNCYWTTSKKPPRFMGMSFDQWQERGFDAGSVVADPLFVNAGKRDFRFKSDKNARRIGFTPIDLRGVGPRKPGMLQRRQGSKSGI